MKSVARQTRLQARLVSFCADAVLWAAALMAASGAGLLLEAVVDSIRYGTTR